MIPLVGLTRRGRWAILLRMVTHRGGCHCGAVRFEADGPAKLEVHECNCSMCRKRGYLHWIVPDGQFRLLQGDASLETYRFNTDVARHLFCRTCGIQSFYVPRSHPDAWSVNLRCLDDGSVEDFVVLPFDGRNWEEARAALDE